MYSKTNIKKAKARFLKVCEKKSKKDAVEDIINKYGEEILAYLREEMIEPWEEDAYREQHYPNRAEENWYVPGRYRHLHSGSRVQVIRARYKSPCTVCKEIIHAGEVVEWVPGVGVRHRSDCFTPKRRELPVEYIPPIEQTTYEITEPVPAYEYNPRIVLKPRKNQYGEYVVAWYGDDGKYDEGKTYYTDDKQDAIDTMAFLKKHHGIAQNPMAEGEEEYLESMERDAKRKFEASQGWPEQNPRWSTTEQIKNINKHILTAEMDYTLLKTELEMGKSPSKIRLMSAWSNLATAKQKIMGIPFETMNIEQQQGCSTFLSRMYDMENKLNSLERISGVWD